MQFLVVDHIVLNTFSETVVCSAEECCLALLNTSCMNVTKYFVTVDLMIFLHMQTFKFSLCFPDRVLRVKVGFKFRNKKVVIRKPCEFVRFKESGFEAIECRAFEV